MNMCPPMTVASYRDINEKLHDIYISVADMSMKQAVYYVQKSMNSNANHNDILNTEIAIDGSWQKRGHSSLNCVITGVSPVNKKVIDYFVYTKFCSFCARQRKSNSKKEHKYKVNHNRSAGAVPFFQESIKKYNLRYAHYIGDGDTESFKKVLESKPYEENFLP